MTILHSWCCWRSVRKGSFACGFYTAFYYTINAAHSSVIFHEELKFLKNCSSEVKQATFLDHDTTSQTSMTFTLILLTISSCGVLSSCLLLYGLYRDTKILLIPWIVNMVLYIIQDIIYITYNLIEHAVKWNPSIAILITIDLFITSLNIYALLCVISQYQEYKAGRGRAEDDQNIRIPNIQYSTQPTATSYLSSRKPASFQEVRPTPTQSPSGTAPHTSIGTEDVSPSTGHKGPRKSVKFPDNTNPGNGGQLLDPWAIDVKPVMMHKGSDTAPLIETHTEPVLQTNL